MTLPPCPMISAIGYVYDRLTAVHSTCSLRAINLTCFGSSQSWMISPGLLGSGPVRTVIDMLNSSNGRVLSSDVLAGLVEEPGDEGPALAADFFAALVAAAAAVASGEADRGDNGGTALRSQVRCCVHRLLQD